MKELLEFEKRIGISFRNKELLHAALTHASYTNEREGWGTKHNERLEFLGDAVIELVVTEYLLDVFPNKREGELTSLRSALVNTRALGELAKNLGFKKALRLSRGEQRGNERAQEYILGNAFEAFCGALYKDQGLERVRLFLENTVLSRLQNVLTHNLHTDPKSTFQEKAQEITRATPIYRLLKEKGPAHKKNFVVGIYLKEELIAKGEGLSKKEAEVMAAGAALEITGWGASPSENRSKEELYAKLLRECSAKTTRS